MSQLGDAWCGYRKCVARLRLAAVESKKAEDREDKFFWLVSAGFWYRQALSYLRAINKLSIDYELPF